ncbi:hypothetical protein ACFFQF_26125 [Haladaptatus pallidirubidus]|uniref:DUF7988 domain-containing protein n=1 Tax=Haladaptatus pallidirubidus TaxID=1008152 RepID=A0AAV3UN39_9EURY|nr:hypothetical protein [Haladaptatus pallidirubidus]
MVDPEIAVRKYILAEHAETVTFLLRCADRVAESWNDEVTPDQTSATTDPKMVVKPFSRELRKVGIVATFPTILSGAVSAAEFSMQAKPVPAPPYVALTSRGPVLRATVSAGRLVISFRVFDVIRNGRTRYVRGASDPETVVSAELK